MDPNLKSVINKITMAGNGNSRVIREDNGGTYKIEVRQGGVWIRVISGLTKTIADSLVQQASNRTICG